MTNIPSGVTSLESYTFNGCPNVKITSFGNVENGNSITEIDASCFLHAGNGNIGPDVTEIVIGKSVHTIGENAFGNYGKNTLEIVYFALSEDEVNEKGWNHKYLLGDEDLNGRITFSYNYISK